MSTKKNRGIFTHLLWQTVSKYLVDAKTSLYIHSHGIRTRQIHNTQYGRSRAKTTRRVKLLLGSGSTCGTLLSLFPLRWASVIVAESVLCVRTDTVLCKRIFFFFFPRLNVPAKFSFFLTCICFARFLSTDLYQPRAHIKSRWPSRQTYKRTLVRTARTNTCREYGLGQSSCSPNAAKRCSGQRQQVSVNWNGHGAETYLHPSQHIM